MLPHWIYARSQFNCTVAPLHRKWIPGFNGSYCNGRLTEMVSTVLLGAHVQGAEEDAREDSQGCCRCYCLRMCIGSGRGRKGRLTRMLLMLLLAHVYRERERMQATGAPPVWTHPRTLEPCMTQIRGRCPGFLCSWTPSQEPHSPRLSYATLHNPCSVLLYCFGHNADSLSALGRVHSAERTRFSLLAQTTD